MPTPPPPPGDRPGSEETSAEAQGTYTPGTRPALHFDWRDWLPYLDAADAPEDQKREMIETLWAIILTFVDLGWEVTDRPAEARAETCGQALDLTAALRAAVVNSEDTQQPAKEEV